MSTVIDTAANDPALNVTPPDVGKPQVGIVLPDWNQSELPEEFPFYAYPQIDNNAFSGVVIDQNVVRPEDRPPAVAVEENEKAQEAIDSYEADAANDWIGARRGADAIDLPQSVYLSPDLSFTDPPGIEEDFDAVEDVELTLRPRLREPL